MSWPWKWCPSCYRVHPSTVRCMSKVERAQAWTFPCWVRRPFDWEVFLELEAATPGALRYIEDHGGAK